VTWIASAMSDEDRRVVEERGGETFDGATQSGAACRVRLLAHDPAAYDLYYNGIANGVLWFLLHYLWGLASEPELGPDFRRAWRDGYERVNRAFAAAVLEELDREPGAAVCFQDYHLFLAPAYVRGKRGVRSCSSCASTEPIRRRTSCAAFAPSLFCSNSTRSSPGPSGCSRCSIRPGRRCASTRNTSRRSSARRAT